MISVKHAQKLVLKQVEPLKNKLKKLNKLNDGEILAEDFHADSDLPPFDRIAMDGIAIKFSDFEKGIKKFNISACQQAGEAQKKLNNSNSSKNAGNLANCMEVMTGAVLPQNVDTVVKIEELNVKNNFAELKNDNIKITKGQNVQKKGIEYKKGKNLVKKGTKILPTHCAIAASIGKNKISIKKSPKIAIISTGNELVNIDQKPLPHQIRRSNTYTIANSLRKNGFFKNSLYHLQDDKIEIEKKLTKILQTQQIIIISGGVSAGKFDFLPEILKKLGATKIFHKVTQRPGKPLWFGTFQLKKNPANKKLIFGLPGNPVSALICHTRYILPALWKMKGIDLCLNQLYTKIDQEIILKNNLTHFFPVKLNFNKNAEISAKTVNFKGSGDFASLAKSDGFIELSEKNNSTNKTYPFFYW